MEMFVSSREQGFFKNLLKPEFSVLEYGSGGSTLIIQDIVKELVSIEHQQAWYNKVKEYIKDNVKLLLVPPDKSYSEGGHDGTYEQFKSYINSGLTYGPYNLIFVDGRARVDCCRAAKNKLTADGIIVVHDFNRFEYKVLLNDFIVINSLETMSVLKPK